MVISLSTRFPSVGEEFEIVVDQANRDSKPCGNSLTPQETSQGSKIYFCMKP